MPTVTKPKPKAATVVEVPQYEIPLVVVTPHMRGIPVRDCQWLLSGNNEILHPRTKQTLRTYTGRIDKEYGPTTAGATKEAKWEIGYPANACDGVFGQELYEYLIGRRTIPANYLARRKDRLAVAPKIKALQLAITQIGYKEHSINGRGNYQKYGDWYGWNGVAWCAIFVSWNITEATGVLWKHAYVPDIVAAARSGQWYLTITHDPEPGDLVAYGSDYHHIEFFEHETDGNSFSAVGGNTSISNFSNGGQVARSDRYYSTVGAFMRLTLPTPKEL